MEVTTVGIDPNIGQPREKISHCPWNCGSEGYAALDEFGYCKHLVGFTNDGKEVEPILAGEERFAGRKVVRGDKKQPILKGDKIVNPERLQIDKGIGHIAKLWVSSRVYRPDNSDNAEPLHSPTPANNDPPAWANALLQSVAHLNSRLDALEDAQTRPEPALAEV